MKKKSKLIITLLSLLLVIGLGTKTVSAEKKATEGKNEADVEFYAPTPKKEEVKPPEKKPSESKILSPVTRLLPKTGETKINQLLPFVGVSLIAVVFVMKRKKVGEMNEN